jgi:hypothetical protein
VGGVGGEVGRWGGGVVCFFFFVLSWGEAQKGLDAALYGGLYIEEHT